MARCQFFRFYFYINRAVIQYLYILLVEYHSSYPHCICSVIEGVLYGCRAEMRTRACRTASRCATIWATPHPVKYLYRLISFNTKYFTQILRPPLSGWVIGKTHLYGFLQAFLYRKRPPQQNRDRRKRHSSSTQEWGHSGMAWGNCVSQAAQAGWCYQDIPPPP